MAAASHNQALLCRYDLLKVLEAPKTMLTASWRVVTASCNDKQGWAYSQNHAVSRGCIASVYLSYIAVSWLHAP